MERNSSAGDLTERLRRRLASERRDIEELTARELGRLAENSRRVARSALRTIERDTEEATGRMSKLLTKAWLRPLIVRMSLWLGIFGGSWATMRWLAMSIQDRIEIAVGLDRDIKDARRTLAQLEVDTWGIVFHEINGGSLWCRRAGWPIRPGGLDERPALKLSPQPFRTSPQPSRFRSDGGHDTVIADGRHRLVPDDHVELHLLDRVAVCVSHHSPEP